MKYLLTRHPFLISFGIMQIFFSAPGQTFLISLFIPFIVKDLHISQTLAATIYSTATLCAALILNPAGRLIDKYAVTTVLKTITVAMALGCAIIANAQSIFTLFLGYFFIRLIGQGVFGLTASTLMIKNFVKNRGKSLGLITLGFPISEAIFPSITLILITSIGWRATYGIWGVIMISIMLPLQLFLVSRSRIQHGQFQSGEIDVNPQHLRGQPEKRHIRAHKDIPLGQALKDIKFYLILAAACLPPMVVTGLFYHQVSLFESNQWPLGLAVTGFAIYAFFKAAGSIGIGIVVDKHGPFTPFILLIFMLGLGTFFAGKGGPSYTIYTYFILIGAALGFSSPVTNVVWPYFYGVKYIGSIKGMVATCRNGVTALSPLPMAMAMDRGISINTILMYLGFTIILLSFLPLMVKYLDKNENV